MPKAGGWNGTKSGRLPCSGHWLTKAMLRECTVWHCAINKGWEWKKTGSVIFIGCKKRLMRKVGLRRKNSKPKGAGKSVSGIAGRSGCFSRVKLFENEKGNGRSSLILHRDFDGRSLKTKKVFLQIGSYG